MKSIDRRYNFCKQNIRKFIYIKKEKTDMNKKTHENLDSQTDEILEKTIETLKENYDSSAFVFTRKKVGVNGAKAEVFVCDKDKSDEYSIFIVKHVS
jgi:hypothetical protein